MICRICLVWMLSLVWAGVRAGALHVDVAWLAASDRAQVLPVDVRPPERFIEGHIPGAVNLPAEATWGDRARGDLLPSVHRLQALIRAAGIDGHRTVVLYDEYPGLDVGRVFWLLELAGVPGVRYLADGLAGWRKAGRPLELGAVKPEPSDFVVHLREARYASRLDAMLASRGTGGVLLDARPRAEFSGREKVDAPRAGHIPGAINIPVHKAFVDKVDTSPLKSLQALRKLYARLPREEQIITYCRRGRGAGLTYMLLRDLGYPVSVYAGSWFEWSRDLLLPVETE